MTRANVGILLALVALIVFLAVLAGWVGDPHEIKALAAGGLILAVAVLV